MPTGSIPNGEAGECRQAQSPMAKPGNAGGRQATKKADKRQLFLSIKFHEVISLPVLLQFCTP